MRAPQEAVIPEGLVDDEYTDNAEAIAAALRCARAPSVGRARGDEAAAGGGRPLDVLPELRDKSDPSRGDAGDDG